MLIATVSFGNDLNIISLARVWKKPLCQNPMHSGWELRCSVPSSYQTKLSEMVAIRAIFGIEAHFSNIVRILDCAKMAQNKVVFSD